ncbi:MAG: LamG domain-containing protein, partial [Clostridia bacterium]|nr:LamG domain-containing protein [Clostridia bacterium]
MNKLLKRLLSGAIAAAMVIGSLVMPVMADSVTEIPPNLEVNFDTATANYTLEGGATLEENSYGKSLASSSGKYAVINDVSAINTCEGDFTLAITLNPATDAMWTRAYDIGSGTDAYIFLAPSSSFGTGQPRFVIKSATTKTEQALESTKTLNIGEWNSVVVTRSGSTTKMYVNGEAAGSTTEITYNLKDAGTTTQNWLGRSQYSADPYFSGLIDDFRFYDFAVDEPIAKKYDAIAKSYEEVDAAAKRKQLIYDNN